MERLPFLTNPTRKRGRNMYHDTRKIHEPSAEAREGAVMQIANMRKEYIWGGLSEADMDTDPVRQFEKWFQQALQANLPEPNAMTLATATPDGQPSARVVLLKAFDASGFAFFT